MKERDCTLDFAKAQLLPRLQAPRTGTNDFRIQQSADCDDDDNTGANMEGRKREKCEELINFSHRVLALLFRLPTRKSLISLFRGFVSSA